MRTPPLARQLLADLLEVSARRLSSPLERLQHLKFRFDPRLFVPRAPLAGPSNLLRPIEPELRVLVLVPPGRILRRNERTRRKTIVPTLSLSLGTPLLSDLAGR